MHTLKDCVAVGKELPVGVCCAVAKSCVDVTLIIAEGEALADCEDEAVADATAVVAALAEGDDVLLRDRVAGLADGEPEYEAEPEADVDVRGDAVGLRESVTDALLLGQRVIVGVSEPDADVATDADATDAVDEPDSTVVTLGDADAQSDAAVVADTLTWLLDDDDGVVAPDADGETDATRDAVEFTLPVESALVDDGEMVLVRVADEQPEFDRVGDVDGDADVDDVTDREREGDVVADGERVKASGVTVPLALTLALPDTVSD